MADTYSGYTLEELDLLATALKANAPLSREAWAALRSAFPALISALRGEWKTMETAPRDGTTILGGWSDDGHREIIHWEGEGGWRGDASGFWHPDNWPTHWRPLPAPPSLAHSREESSLADDGEPV